MSNTYMIDFLNEITILQGIFLFVLLTGLLFIIYGILNNKEVKTNGVES